MTGRGISVYHSVFSDQCIHLHFQNLHVLDRILLQDTLQLKTNHFQYAAGRCVIGKRFCVDSQDITVPENIVTDLLYNIGHDTFAPVFFSNEKLLSLSAESMVRIKSSASCAV